MNGSTSNPPSKYRADLLFWSLVIWGLHWLFGAELDQMAGAVLNSRLSLEEIKVPELKKRWGMMQGTYACVGRTSPAHRGRGLTVLGHSRVISTLLLSARLWQGMEDEGKIGRLIEIIIRRTSMTVVSRVAQCLSHAGRCVSSR